MYFFKNFLLEYCFEAFPKKLSGKEYACSAGDAGHVSSVPGLRRSPGGSSGNPLQYSCLESPWTEEPGRLQPKRAAESQRRLSTHACMFFTASWCFLPDDKADQPHVDVHPLFLDSSPLGHQRLLGGVP